MKSGILEAYTDVILSGALSLKKGDRLWIRSEPAHMDLVRRLSEKAYKLGAEFVRVSLDDPVFDRIRVDHSADDDYLDYVPGHTAAMYESVVAEGFRALAIRGPSDPDLMKGADVERLGRMSKASSQARRGFLDAISSNRIPWNVCLAPTSAWAARVLGDPVNWEERIWDVLIPILRLDTPSPSEAWRTHDRELKRRAAFLNEKQFSSFRFKGPGTDLTVGMLPDRRFLGGSCSSADGTVFFPNIPTEEVFSTPDMNSAEGKVTCTRPVTVLGAQVEDAWFIFEGGRVIRCGAGENSDVLKKYVETDSGSARLGEIALVGTDSPIYRSNLVFHNILFDENATCHIALGNGYTDCIEGGTEMTGDEIAATGCNRSLVHTDFMIGGASVDVTGVSSDGEETVVIKNGEFVI